MNKINIEEKVYNPKFYPDSELRGKSGIYQIRNLENGKIYVGSAENFKRRKYEHFYSLKNNIHCNEHIQDSYNLYGKDNFIFEVIEFIEDEDKLIECEQYWMDRLDVCNRDKGYNIQPNAGRLSMTDEIRAKLCETRKGTQIGEKNNMYGKHHTEETKRKISEAHKGKIPWNKGVSMTQEMYEKCKPTMFKKGQISFNKGKTGELSHMYGKHLTEEAKRKISEANSGSKNKSAVKVVRLFDNKIYDTMKMCAEDNNLSSRTIYVHCINELKTTDRKFMYYRDWLKKEENKNNG